MSRSRAERLRGLFLAVCDLPDDARAQHLARACGEDVTLRRDVERLLRHDAPPGAHLIDRPLVPNESRDAMFAESPPTLPAEIAGFRVTRRIGFGSMGTVYEAEQEHPRRRVAVKVLRLGLATDDARRRFEDEADILARLDHPSIARVFSSGTVDLGPGPSPYLVMERLEGLPPDEYARRAGLDVNGRLALIARIADGVAHAHARGVIHRDLKPANILVTAEGTPKIFDFGVARLVAADRREPMPPKTLDGQLLGTLATMSPEQARGDPEQVDTRTDVYALGVLAYLLLAGRMPIETDGVDLPEGLRRVQQDEPAPLSRIDRRFRGDVEVSIGKALRKEREERYSSAAEFAAELGRLLRDEPIMARAPGALESLARVARRHRGLAVAVAVVAVGLVVALVGAGWGLVQARAALAESAAVTDFLEGLFTSVNPEVLGRDVRAEDVLRAAEGRLDRGFADRPALAARLRETLGGAWWSLGRFEESEASLRLAWEHHRHERGPEDPRTFEVQTSLGRALARNGRFAEAVPLLEEARRSAAAALGPGDLRTLHAGVTLGQAFRLEARFDEAVELVRATLAEARAHHGDDHAVTAECRFELAADLFAVSRTEEAESEVREALRVHRELLRSEPVVTLPLRGLLASILLARGEYDEALRLVRKEVLTLREVYGDEHPTTLRAMHRLAFQLADRSRLDEALEWSTRSLDGLRRALGDTDRATLHAVIERARQFAELGRLDEAVALADEAAETAARVFGEKHDTTFSALAIRATLHRLMGESAEAERLLESLLLTAREVYGNESSNVASTLANLAATKVDLDRMDAARALYEEAIELGERVYGPDHPKQHEIRVGLGAVHISTGRTDLARPLFEEAIRVGRAAFGDDHEKTIVARYFLAMADMNEGRVAEARVVLDELMRRATGTLGAGHRVTAAMREVLSMVDRRPEAPGD